MPSTIVTKHSTTASAVPTLSDLVQGELAVNFPDKKIYTRDDTNTIVELGAGAYTLTAGAGLTGTGTVDSEPTFAVGAGTGITVNADDVALDTSSTRNTDHAAVSITAGAGLTGGGDISASRTIDVVGGTGIIANANDIAFDTTWGDARYLQSFSEADTLATVTARGATTSDACTFNGDVSFRGAVDLADNDILRFGTGDDAELFCDGAHFYLDLNSGIGNFYIRDGTTTRFTFDDAGDFTATGNVTAYSDVRLKEDIYEMDDALEGIGALRGYRYKRRDLDSRPDAGLIAQEVQAVLPEAVHTGDDGVLSVNYNAVVAMLVQAVATMINDWYEDA